MKAFPFFLIFLFSLASCAQPSKGKVSRTSLVTMSSISIDTNWVSKVEKSKEEWMKLLSKEQFYVARESGTERPFSSKLYENHEKGVFVCSSCENPLFSSETKFESGTGWPSFFKPYFSRSVKVGSDNSHGMVRDEVKCARCDAHLGHVFDDGPEPTGQRYCMNGVSLKFQKENNLKKATFASGCFWCVEAVFESVKGVEEAISGYSGGTKDNPTYEEVGSGNTGHSESVEVYYDSTKISYPELLKVYFACGDPTQVNGQGPDQGTAYRSMVFYKNMVEKKIIEDYIKNLTASGKYSRPIAVEVSPFVKFWPAEDYHQDYVKLNPTQRYVLGESIPRLNRTKKLIPELLKK
jgi:peptide methionine sulfoxide reductase msrA/msrB